MPLVAHNDLPTFAKLKQEGLQVLTPGLANQQDIRELHIGLLNMMPDAALAATERQFLRLIGESNPIAQFFVHPFTLDALPRDDSARAHIASYYDSFEQIKQQGLDALIITGANVIGADLSEEVFWEDLIEVADWAHENVTSTLCSCLATHAGSISVTDKSVKSSVVKNGEYIDTGSSMFRIRWLTTLTRSLMCHIPAGTLFTRHSLKPVASGSSSPGTMAVFISRPARMVFVPCFSRVTPNTIPYPC